MEVTALPGRLALALLVLCVFADHTDHPAAVDDLALDANLFHRCSDFHLLLPFLQLPAISRQLSALFSRLSALSTFSEKPES